MALSQFSNGRIKHFLESAASDILLRSVSGVRRTRAYVSPLVKLHGPRSSGNPSVLVIAPTRESADMIRGVFLSLKESSSIVVAVLGGSDKDSNILELSKGCDYIIGTPARLGSLFHSGRLNTSHLNVIVLEEADLLLTSQVVLDFIEKAVPPMTQRVLCASSVSEWMKDTLSDITRVGYTMEEILDTRTSSVAVDPRIEHFYSIVSGSDELDQLRHILDSAPNREQCIVYCHSEAQVCLIATKFPNLRPVLSDMSAAVFESQISGLSGNIVSTVNCLEAKTELLGKAKLVIFMGSLPSTLPEYGAVLAPMSEVRKVFALIRNKESQILTKNLRPAIHFKTLPVVSRDELAIKFSTHQLAALDGITQEIPPAIQSLVMGPTGGQFLAGLTTICLSRKSLFEQRKSALSGQPNFSPVLLIDPFMKKIKSAQMAHEMVQKCLEGRNLFGRIALSEKGFVVDIHDEWVAQFIEHPKLKTKNIRAIFLTSMPRLIVDEAAFAKRQTKRDRKSFIRRTR